MTDPGITLNIYNKPPKFEDNTNDNTNDNINQNETGLNLSSNLPQSNLDNIRNNETSAPNANYGQQTMDNTRNNNFESSVNYQSSVQPIPIQPYPQQKIIGYQQIPIAQVRPIAVTPITTPIVRPYNNPQYGRPVIIQQKQNNQQPTTYIIKEEKKKKDDSCCTGFMAGLGTFLAACCCLLCLSGAAGGRGRGRRGRW